MRVQQNLILVLVLITSVFGSTQLMAQEYDDLYFTSKDRKMLKLDKGDGQEANDSRATYESYSNNTYADDYSAKNVNPEYIARYRSQAAGTSSTGNPSYGTYDEELEYFPEEETVSEPVVINNYYGGTPYGAINDPWRVRNNFGFGYDPFWGWNTGFNMSFGWGNGWGNFGWGNGFGNPWGPGFGFYDPFFGPPIYDPFFPRWGFNNRFYRRNAFVGGFYGGGFYGGQVIVVGEATRTRRVVRGGGRYVRGGSVTGVSRGSVASTSRRTDARSSVNTAGRSASNGRVSKDYSRTQNEYYNRARRSNAGVTSNNRASRSSSDYSSGRTSRSYQPNRSATRSRSSTSNTVTRSRSTQNSSVTNGQRTTSPSRRYSTSGTKSSSYSRSYNSPSRSKSNSYSTPSRSNSSRSRSYSPSRSSGSSKSYTPSRSSSGSRSSGSRSSGGGRSSGSSRSRGN